jgi:D-sedoheptulose 7-phosphate isomerase
MIGGSNMNDGKAIERYRDEFFDIVRRAECSRHGRAIALAEWLYQIVSKLDELKREKRYLFFLGNGASCSMASHFATDFTKNMGIRATSLSDGPLVTCFSNDYCYEDAYKEMLRQYMSDGDALIAISSSGRSRNIVNAASYVRECLSRSTVITFSAFRSDNPLRALGHYGLYLDCAEYGRVESGHAYYLHLVTDFFRNLSSDGEVLGKEQFSSCPGRGGSL